MAAAAIPAPQQRAILDEVSYQAAPGMTYEEWAEAGERFQLYARASNWWLGDWLLIGERRFGEDRAFAAVDLSGLEYSTVTAARWLAGKIEPARRRTDLSWSHHREVGAMPPAEQDRWLERAAIDGMSRDELRRAVAAAKEQLARPPAGEEQEPPAAGTPAAPNARGHLAAVPDPEPARSITAGYDDSPEFLEACRLRFGETRGAEIFTFVQSWAQRHAPKLASALE